MNWLIATIVVAAYLLKLALDKAVTAVIHAIQAESIQNRQTFRVMEDMRFQQRDLLAHLDKLQLQHMELWEHYTNKRVHRDVMEQFNYRMTGDTADS